MEKLGDVTKGLVSRDSPRQSGTAQSKPGIRTQPPVKDWLADVEIPRTVMSAWRETGKPRCLRRALSEDERIVLESRRAELQPWMAGFRDSEKDRVMLAVADMYAAFPSMNSKKEREAMAKLESVMRVLADFPVWAIEKACANIRENGIIRMDGDRYTVDRHWPPSDPELVEAVRQERRLYGDQYDRVVEVLQAEVEA
jgi:hypothetical protein